MYNERRAIQNIKDNSCPEEQLQIGIAHTPGGKRDDEQNRSESEAAGMVNWRHGLLPFAQ
jgi:hypothetical protein